VNPLPLKRLALGFALLLLGQLFGGCAINPQQDSSIPWQKPADWEGQLPGMGSPGTGH